MLGADAASVIRAARQLKNVKRVGAWGISQAGWIIPYALSEKPPAEFAILVSPAGVHPHEQVGFFLHNQLKSWGLSDANVAKADTMHEETSLYYAGRLDQAKAQATVNSYKDEVWFKKVVTHPYWDEMTPEGLLLTPDKLAEALAKRPQDFEIYRSPSSFEEYEPVYAALTVPTLVIYGSVDELVPIKRSRAVMEPALRKAGVPYEIKVFDGATHDIQTQDEHVRQDYLDFMVDWAKTRFSKSG
jgi:pimeloyl-ACP methyl ester carboxylesterase